MPQKTEHPLQEGPVPFRELLRTMLSPGILVILVVCCGAEILLMAADAGLTGSRLWRSLAYQNGAFWPGLLQNWRPNFPAQPVTMFASYAFLHSDFWHLAGNMAALVFLGRIILEQNGRGGFVFIYGMAVLGGAVGFALLTSGVTPMVGASGGLFGLAGAWQFRDWRSLRQARKGTWPVWRTVLVLVGLNIVLWGLNGGHLAWEAHLGGFVFGAAAAWVLE